MEQSIKNTSLDFTVAIPTYNGVERLPKVLDQLLNQTGVEKINWEIIIIDNNSYDQTSELIQNYQKSHNTDFSLKYFLETKQGIPFARHRAVSEASGEFIAFIDDDNVPATDWVVAAYNFGKEHPEAGAWSGQIHGEYEVKPPQNFKKIQSFLAIREYGSSTHLFDPDNLRLPPGAGLVVRKQAWCESVPATPALHGKLPGLFVQGDDYEALLYIHKAGWKILYNPAMHIYHQIPHWRFERDYLITLARGCGLCVFQLRLVNAKNWQKPILFIKTILGNLRRVLQHLIKNKINFSNDIILTFEMQFYLASMMSPFYCLKCWINSFYLKN
ncbi:MAG: hormogonium polysaccharide biosynthesis glycosyltransferase HpsE [Trichormus sp. ATA11-4-KO1]|jgi:glycosyltransferase involved in cell wall biosynthesis|nr:hormogonium polysaccharide biosynthesis glycosyltransferase HpsE [Trichormus sp. ATA11-4-KO1]